MGSPQDKSHFHNLCVPAQKKKKLSLCKRAERGGGGKGELGQERGGWWKRGRGGKVEGRVWKGRGGKGEGAGKWRTGLREGGVGKGMARGAGVRERGCGGRRGLCWERSGKGRAVEGEGICDGTRERVGGVGRERGGGVGGGGELIV